LYVDNSKASRIWNNDVISNEDFRIAYWCCANRFFDGIIDEVRVYNRALSDSEIKALYEATK